MKRKKRGEKREEKKTNLPIFLTFFIWCDKKGVKFAKRGGKKKEGEAHQHRGPT